jgi:hypothetical protein
MRVVFRNVHLRYDTMEHDNLLRNVGKAADRLLTRTAGGLYKYDDDGFVSVFVLCPRLETKASPIL